MTVPHPGQNRRMVECFRTGTTPAETFRDGLAVAEILMTLYRSAERGRTLNFGEEDPQDYIPPVACASSR